MTLSSLGGASRPAVGRASCRAIAPPPILSASPNEAKTLPMYETVGVFTSREAMAHNPLHKSIFDVFIIYLCGPGRERETGGA